MTVGLDYHAFYVDDSYLGLHYELMAEFLLSSLHKRVGERYG